MIVKKQQVEERFGLKNVIDKANEEEVKAQIEKEFPKKTPFWMEYNPKKGIIEFKNNGGLKNPKPIKVNEDKSWGFGAGGVTAQADWNQKDEHAVDFVKNKPTIPEPVTVDQIYDGTSANAQSGKAVKQAVDEAVSSVYKPAGSIAFAELPTLGASVLGNLYNITDAFTTTSDFVEGSGVSYPANTNVGVIKRNNNYYFDVMTGVFSTALASLTDVTLTTPSDGDALVYDSDSGKWVNGAVAGGTVDQTYNSSSANAQSGVAINGAGFLTKDMSAIAIGTTASAVSQSVAIGQGASSTGGGAIALGNNEITATGQCIAIGNYIETGSSYNAIAIGNGPNGYAKTKATGSSAIALGSYSQATSSNTIAVGTNTYANSDSATAIGNSAKAQANYAIQIGYGTNSTANTLSVGLSTSNNYQLLDSSGHIPAGRLGTLPSADGTYIPVLTITSGVPSISWVSYSP